MCFRRTQAVFTAVCPQGSYFNVGAGIVADSIPEAEYDETLAKARGFLAALQLPEAPGVASSSSDVMPISLRA